MMSVSLYNCGHCKLPQLVGQRCHCRTPEDEAFDELAKKQGMWGGGFQAKRQMAADKQEPAQESWREFASDYERGFIDGMQKQAQSSVDKAVNMMAQPAQEPNYWLGYGLQAHTEKPFENATALYITPPKREWVGLTDEEIAGLWTSRVSWTNNNFARAIEQALKERNHGT